MPLFYYTFKQWSDSDTVDVLFNNVMKTSLDQNLVLPEFGPKILSLYVVKFGPSRTQIDSLREMSIENTLVTIEHVMILNSWKQFYITTALV